MCRSPNMERAQKLLYGLVVTYRNTGSLLQSTDLQNNFNASQDLINTLHAEIVSLKSKNSDIYHQLHMERQRRKRATSKHGSMASQILLLKKADAISLVQLSKD